MSLKKRPRHHDDAERTLALHERMVYYCNDITDLHTLLIENEGRSDFDINACLPLQPPGSKRATPEERIRMEHTTLLYYAVVLEDTERVALLLLFGADPHAAASSMVTLNTKTAIDLAHVRSNGLIIIRALLYDTNTRNGGSSAAAVDAALVETARSSLQFSLMWLLEGRGARLQSAVLYRALDALDQQRFSQEALNIVHRLTGPLYNQDTTPYIDMFPHAMALLEGPRHGPHALHNTLSMPGVMQRA